MADSNAAEAAIYELEASLLGAVLADPPNTLPRIETLSGEDFYDGPNGVNAQILADVRDAAERGEVSPAAVAARFAWCDMAGFVLDCWDKGPPATEAAPLARQVAVAAVQRRLFAETARPGLSLERLRRAVSESDARLEALDDTAGRLAASPFAWCEAQDMPARQWLYGRHLIRRYVSCTVAPGGLGKTSLLVAEALAMASGRALLGESVAPGLKVWLFNAEDPLEELRRRVVAACRHHGLKRADVDGRLFLDSGRDSPLIIARQDRGGLSVCRPVVRRLEAEIARRGVDVMIVDPFASVHAVGENDNMAINAVVAEWGAIAERTGCAVELVHHVRKGGPGQLETTVEDARGASALIAAARSARVLNPMTKAQAEKWSIEGRRAYFRVDSGKSNLAAPDAHARWRRLASVDLENGAVGASDEVGVAEVWTPPSVFEGVKPADTLAVQQKVAAGSWRAASNSAAWVGHAAAEVLGLDLEKAGDRARIRAMLAEWLRTGALVQEDQLDASRRPRTHVVVGEWITL